MAQIQWQGCISHISHAIFLLLETHKQDALLHLKSECLNKSIDQASKGKKKPQTCLHWSLRKNLLVFKKPRLSFQMLLRWSYCNPSDNHEQHLHTENRWIISGVQWICLPLYYQGGWTLEQAAQGSGYNPKSTRVQEVFVQHMGGWLWLSCARPELFLDPCDPFQLRIFWDCTEVTFTSGWTEPRTLLT